MPIITLLTDFGSQDYFVGAMKGTILSISPRAVIVDITHEIPPQDIQTAAFNLVAVYKDFPPGTVHVAVVDPGVGSSRRGVVIECAGQLFVGPDNGLFSWTCQREEEFQAVHLLNEKFFRQPSSQTFHGRDIFAPVAAALANGATLKEFGPLIDDLVRLASLEPRELNDGALEGRIINIDRFGNCVTSFTRDHLAKLGKVQLLINGHQISSVREFFAAGAADGELFGIFGSAGFMEVAARNSSAADLLGVARGHAVKLLR